MPPGPEGFSPRGGPFNSIRVVATASSDLAGRWPARRPRPLLDKLPNDTPRVMLIKGAVMPSLDGRNL